LRKQSHAIACQGGDHHNPIDFEITPCNRSSAAISRIQGDFENKSHNPHPMRQVRRKGYFCTSNPHCLSHFPTSPADSEKFSSKSAEHSLSGLLKC
jgi:hypothetical protein